MKHVPLCMDLQASVPHTFRERYGGIASKLDMGRTANDGECILSNRPRAQFNHHETAFHKETRKEKVGGSLLAGASCYLKANGARNVR